MSFARIVNSGRNYVLTVTATSGTLMRSAAVQVTVQ